MTANGETDRLSRLLSRAKNLHEILVVVTFISAVSHLFLIRKFAPTVLVLFFFPPAFAIACGTSAVLPSTKLLGRSFLLLLVIGDAIAPFRSICPGLDGFPDLPRTASRILSWYCVVYLFYVFVVVPPVFFIRPLVQRRRGQAPYLSWPTCCLGLLLWLVMGPASLWLLAFLLGFASLPR